MIGRILRALLATVMCLGVFALTLPTRAVAAPQHKTMSCCAKSHTEPPQKHCGDEPQKSADNDCCAACANSVALFVAPQAPLIFSPERGEKLAAAATTQSSRSERPPVPPPRSAIG